MLKVSSTAFINLSQKSQEPTLCPITDSDERSFLLDSGLFLSLGPSLDPSSAASESQSTPLSFTWLDPDGDGPDDEF